jgi:hypothetical protein
MIFSVIKMPFFISYETLVNLWASDCQQLRWKVQYLGYDHREFSCAPPCSDIIKWYCQNYAEMLNETWWEAAIINFKPYLTIHETFRIVSSLPVLASCTMKCGSHVLILWKFTQGYCYKFIFSLPCSIVNGPLWLVMSVSTYPGWTAFTMRSSRGSASNARCCIKVRALTPTFDAWYVELGQPSARWFPDFAALKACANKEISYL